MRDRNKKTPPAVAAPMGRWRALAARCLGMAARGEVLSASWHNALFGLFLGGILAYGAGFAWYMLARFDLVNLIRDVSVDDSFYYFQIAHNLAEGKFSTFDGGITRTNGYHPLWLFLITPFYWVFDKEAALFGIKAFEIMLVAGGAALVAAAARLARLPWVLLFAALPMLYHIPFMIAGMEAAAALSMLGLFFLALCLYARHPVRWLWPLAAVAFALPWVRLEYIAISLATTGALCLIERSWQDHPPGAPLGARARSVLSVKAVVPFLTAGAGPLVYFAYNELVFGGIVPVSGATKAVWSQVLWEQDGGYSLAQNFREVLQIPVFDYELLVALEICAYVLLVWWLACRSRSRQDWLLLAFLVGVAGLAVGHLAKFAQTILTVHPYWGSDGWYFVPAYLLKTLIIPVRCYVAIHFIRRFLDPKSPQAANLLSMGIIVVGAAFLFTRADFTGPFQFVDRLGESTHHVSRKDTSYMGVQVMDRVLPKDSVVGSWDDSGVIGYFSRFPVVNLDGLGNSYDYLRAQREGTEATFYQRYGITWFANVWSQKEGTEVHILPAVRDYLVRQRLERSSAGAVLFEGSPYLHHGKNGLHKRQFRLLTTEPPEMAGGLNRSDWFWQRMAPHFDRRSDGVGLIVDGRMAQAFVRDCASEELVVWSWTGAVDELVANAWTQTQTGLCVAASVLPHKALPPVRVETMPLGDYVARLVGDRPPAIRSDWDVYLIENSLIYVKKDPCSPQDAEPTFFLHLDPVDMNDLPSHSKQHGYDNLDFNFDERAAIFDGKCLAEVPLPEYAISAIRTGQYVRVDGGYPPLWKGEIRLGDYVARLVGDRPPAIRSDWDVYLIENSLIYVKKDQCSPQDAEPTFFLHLDPVDMNDLPEYRQQNGFDNLDFNFDERAAIFDGKCLAEVPLPEYAISEIRTGQYVPVDGGYNHLWEGKIRLNE